MNKALRPSLNWSEKNKSAADDWATNLQSHVVIDIVPDQTDHENDANARHKNSGISCASGKTESSK